MRNRFTAMALGLVLAAGCAPDSTLGDGGEALEGAQSAPKLLPAYETEAEKRTSAKGDSYDDYRLAHPEWYAITVPPAKTYRHMVEWEPMQELLLTYSNYTSSDAPVRKSMIDIVVATVKTAKTKVGVIYQTTTAKNDLTAGLKANGLTDADLAGWVTWYQIENDTIWHIDYGPLFLVDDAAGSVAVADFRYYHQRTLDDAVPTKLAQNYLGATTYRMPFDIEGGTFQGDGKGTCFTAQRALQYAGVPASTLEKVWGDYAACTQVVIMKDITDDGTGHIDMFFKLADPTTAIVGEYKDQYVIDAVNKQRMNDNVALLNSITLAGGKKLKVERIPFPAKASGTPRTYINSTFVNGVNLWPVYSNSKDAEAEALAKWKAIMPTYTHVGILADKLASYSGTIHCITRTIPKGSYAKWVPNGTCNGGNCTAPAGGYDGACLAAGGAACWGPKWMCECPDCNNCGGTSTPGSCVGFCGGQSSAGCYCDTDCVQYGDCCGDYQAVCAGTPTGCNGVTFEGCCEGSTLKYCENNSLQTLNCGGGGCGWNPQGPFYDCNQSGADPSGQHPLQCGGACVPNCTGKVCGDNGCGGSCGTCGAGQSCNAGKCVSGCVPNCAGKVCGDNGCGGSCGTCGAGQTCTGGQCTGGGGANSCVGICGGQASGGCYCDPQCVQYNDCCSDYQAACGGTPTGCGGVTFEGCCEGTTLKYCENDTIQGGSCGPNGCGWNAAQGYYDCGYTGADPSGKNPLQCGACTPSCAGKACGDDGCGGSCGTCGAGKSCQAGQCVSTCTPSCAGKACGDDGCGGSCGTCGAGKSCQAGQCVGCTPSCAGKECGDDGCGGSCGTCGAGKSCQAGTCVAGCTPSCAGKECGDDGCGGSCGSCGAGKSCQAGTCVAGCTPSCAGKECGDDGCGGSCGTCGAGQSCDAGSCTGECAPDCAGKECGDDGCGGSCGTCGAGETCDAGTCAAGCAPDCAGKECGDDGCGGSCGTCGAGESCDLGACVGACTPDCAGKECGDDGCGGSCGTCGAGEVCDGGLCATSCTPDCAGKSCGDDGCGGSCGSCGDGQVCKTGVCEAGGSTDEDAGPTGGDAGAGDAAAGEDTTGGSVGDTGGVGGVIPVGGSKSGGCATGGAGTSPGAALLLLLGLALTLRRRVRA